MSNLDRYFLSAGKVVGGFDRAEGDLTEMLRNEGALVHYQDDVSAIPAGFKDKSRTLVVYTPAIPASNSELKFFREKGFTIMKRAQLLGEVTRMSDAVCVAGTHGKTTVSGMIAHLLHQSHLDCTAFLGGISNNYNSNLLLSNTSNISVVEADEYDRSFHWLNPQVAVITSADPDHLDIYGSAEAYRESFEIFTSLILPGGHLIIREGSGVIPRLNRDVKVWSYSETRGDFHARNIRIENGEILFDFVSPRGVIKDVSPGVPARINVENSIAAMAAAGLCGATPDEIRSAMGSFKGIKRRFDFHLKSSEIVFIDDYAHHPEELRAAINSIKALYPGRKLTAVFQPHLYSRTRDFADEFAKSLSLTDDVILLEIYPAREEPIEGVTSRIIFDKITSKEKLLCSKSELLPILRDKQLEVLATFGAGDIGLMIPDIKRVVNKTSEY